MSACRNSACRKETGHEHRRYCLTCMDGNSERYAQIRAQRLAAASWPGGPGKERDAALLMGREFGMTFDQLGEFFGVTRERARQIHSRTRLVKEKEERWAAAKLRGDS